MSSTPPTVVAEGTERAVDRRPLVRARRRRRGSEHFQDGVGGTDAQARPRLDVAAPVTTPSSMTMA